MSSRSFVLIVVTLLLIFSFSGSSLVGSAGNVENAFIYTESDAESAIAAAEERILVSYQGLVKADDAGANTTKLLLILDEAGNLLSKAKLTYQMGNFDSAMNFALLSQEKLNGFVVEVDALTKAAMQKRYWDFTVNVVGSVFAAVGVVCGGLIVWLLLKKKCEREVRTDES